jgi:hypothetical protein
MDSNRIVVHRLARQQPTLLQVPTQCYSFDHAPVAAVFQTAGFVRKWWPNQWAMQAVNNPSPPTPMIKLLANIFRGFSLVFGITAPPPDQDERPFVFLWLGIIAVVIVFCVLLLFVVSKLHVG